MDMLTLSNISGFLTFLQLQILISQFRLFFSELLIYILQFWSRNSEKKKLELWEKSLSTVRYKFKIA